jgi:hypothetical protein
LINQFNKNLLTQSIKTNVLKQSINKNFYKMN